LLICSISLRYKSSLSASERSKSVFFGAIYMEGFRFLIEDF
jgi:hypothetical protein